MNQAVWPDRSAGRVMPRQAYTPWITRVLAWAIDAVPFVIVISVGLAIELATRDTLCAAETTEYDIGPYCVTGNTSYGLAAFLASIVIGFMYVLWNNGYRQGRTGASIGKSVLRFEVLSERTGRPIGFGRCVIRQLAHVVDTLICCIGFLFPLWDARRQTLADKFLKTVCVPTT